MILRSKNKTWVALRLAVLLIAPVVLLILPADFFDEGQSICVSQLLFGLECYACGMTRAFMHLVHFNFMEAFYYNALIFIVFPLLLWVWARWVRRDWLLWRSLTRSAPEQA